nr:hypothetical protein [Novosphingobium panipatense]
MVAELLADSPQEFVFDGGPLWRPEKALDAAHQSGHEGAIPEHRRELEAMMARSSRKWVDQRLASLFVHFHPTREVDGQAFGIWNDEMARLLIDLPHDILAHSIDEAIRKSGHGFAPSVGEIRRYADPLVEQREVQIDRLRRMEAALADPAATEERAQRRANQAAHERHMAEVGR